MSEAAAARSIARAAACNTNSVRSAMGADGSMCKPHRTTSTAEHPLTGRDAVNITQKASGAMVLKSKFPEVMTILTMIEIFSPVSSFLPCTRVILICLVPSWFVSFRSTLTAFDVLDDSLQKHH